MIREVTCNFRFYLKMGRTSVKPRWKHWIFTSNYRCLHTGVPYNTTYGWNRPIIKAQCSCLPVYQIHISVLWVEACQVNVPLLYLYHTDMVKFNISLSNLQILLWQFISYNMLQSRTTCGVLNIICNAIHVERVNVNRFYSETTLNWTWHVVQNLLCPI